MRLRVFFVVFGLGLVAPGWSESTVRPQILSRKPHDAGAFTQGLLIDGEHWLESTGLYGQSELREVNRKTGKVLRRLALPADQFGEGLALLDGKLYQLTWRAGICRVIDRKTFVLLKVFKFEGEGWGLATDGKVLYLSDGSGVIRVMDPETFTEQRRFRVRGTKGVVEGLNELEWVEGELWANIFGSGLLVRIRPRDGMVLGFVDLRHLPIVMDHRPEQDVLNGIARDPETGDIWVTGKLWQALYRIEWPPGGAVLIRP
jgi:glutaminyl-peptide cyclotransferase